MSAGQFTMKVLNGISLAVVVTLVPQALLGELLKALLPIFPAGQPIISLVNLASTLLPVMIGILVAVQFRLTPIQTAVVGICALLGSGVASPAEGGAFTFKGTGLVINSGLTAALAVGMVLLIGERLGNYTILLLSTLTVLIVGSIGAFVTYPVVKIFTLWLGQLINGTTTLQPILMGLILSTLFAALIVSPISTVGIATAIFMDGIAAGTGNLGCVAAGMGLMVAGWKANGFANSIIHIVGSPKVQMANMFAHPKAMAPLLTNAALLGAIGGAFGVKGTPVSTGFGITGLAGPLAALNDPEWGWTLSNVGIVALCWVVLPLLFAFVFSALFERIGWVRPEHYALRFT
ncbi:PTS sugar transporter subunit IIC [Corynebacterium uropygiale]|uniref:PTS sugar transporter subunit IIC n=2 Tax=Corynebacterium uropygiale TaxID=1775911 RepID=A0A9X1QQZ7_9CORY|nr:PTS sugar transporter subunit IIC [Corynebacterium uropygiale]MCF4007526.1 PTS sugar transporter subunit IIC [Corynebacterium uropygiale]